MAAKNSCRNCAWRTLNSWVCTNTNSEYYDISVWGKNSISCGLWEHFGKPEKEKSAKPKIEDLIAENSELKAENAKLKKIIEDYRLQNQILLDNC